VLVGFEEMASAENDRTVGFISKPDKYSVCPISSCVSL
jgi:hypothetical protein